MIISFTGQKYISTGMWVQLTPRALDVLSGAAKQLETEEARMSFYDPDAGARFKVNAAAAGIAFVHRKDGSNIATRGNQKDPAVRDMDRRPLVRPDGKVQITASLRIAPSALAASRMQAAADLFVAGHDVMLFVRGEELHIEWSSENCPCPNCTGVAV